MQNYHIRGLGKKININDSNEINNKKDNLQKEIEIAKNEWERALKLYNDVSEPEVVDYIIYYILATERRYMYLLNKFKNLKGDKEKKLEEKKYENGQD